MPGVTHSYIGSLTSTLVPNFLGVYTCDTIPMEHIKTKKCARFIINTATSFQSSGHFVAVYKQDNMVFYFDSLTLPSPNLFMHHFLEQMDSDHTIVSNKVQIQHPLSQCCAFFCLSFLLHTCTYNGKINMLQTSFNKNFISPPSLHNDIICTSLIKRQINCIMKS